MAGEEGDITFPTLSHHRYVRQLGTKSCMVDPYRNSAATVISYPIVAPAASSQPSTIQTGIEALDRALGLRSSHLYLLDGPAGLVDGFIYKMMVKTLCQSSQRALFVDCSNTFSVHAVAGLCRESGIDPLPVLDSILVSRPFTCYQLNTLMAEIRRMAEEARPPILAFSGLLDLFHGDDVEPGDAEVIFPRLLGDIRALAGLGPAIMVTNRHRWRRRGYLAALAEAADTVLRLRPLAQNRMAIRIEKDPILGEGEVEHAWGLDCQLPLDQFLAGG